jgi:alkanesulfonate monooxygenase SsuD/methylene tetrahydromethanopterin reductase-like flavin-dependent oxidoreductase (luciferase family)
MRPLFEGRDHIAGATPVPLLIAALGGHMLRIAGQMADGTVLGLTGPKTIESHIVPKITAATGEAGRGAPRIVASFPTALTNEPDRARERISELLGMYGMLSSYRAILDREGVDGTGDIAVLGDEKALDAALDRLRDIGVTDFDATILSLNEELEARTLDYLESRL